MQIAVQGLILGLRLELGFGGCTLLGVGHDGLDSCSSLRELGLTSQFSLGERLSARVTDLRRELSLTHFLVDDLRVFADLAPKSVERGFERDFRHCISALFSLVPSEGFRLLIWVCHSKDAAKVLLFLHI